MVQATETKLNYLIERFTRAHDHCNARFYAERLVAQSRTDENLVVLANCHFAAGTYRRVLDVLDFCHSKDANFLAALTHFKLSEFDEAEARLVRDFDGAQQGLKRMLAGNSFPGGSAGLVLLAKLLSRSARIDAAQQAARRAVELDVFNFEAYQLCCELGDPIDADTIFSSANAFSGCLSPGKSRTPAKAADRMLLSTPNKTPRQRLMESDDTGFTPSKMDFGEVNDSYMDQVRL